MEIKKINRLLLVIFLIHIAVVAALEFAPETFELGIILNLSLGELILFIPTLVYLFFRTMGQKKNNVIKTTAEVLCEAEASAETVEYVHKETIWQRLHFHMPRPSTIFYALIFTWLSMPLTTVINAVSMLFVENTVVSLSGFMTEVPFVIMLFLMAVTPAFCEEVVFRGVVYGGYRKDGSKFAAVMLSGLMFGIMHMNLNQALYAFVIGILIALLFESTNSIIPGMLFHFAYNAQSCVLMYLVEAMMPGFYSEASNMPVSPDEMYMMISVYLVIAAICTPLALCLLYKIAKNENRVDQLKEALPRRRNTADTETAPKAKIATLSYILATVVACGYIVYDIVMSKL